MTVRKGAEFGAGECGEESSDEVSVEGEACNGGLYFRDLTLWIVLSKDDGHHLEAGVFLETLTLVISADECEDEV